MENTTTQPQPAEWIAPVLYKEEWVKTLKTNPYPVELGVATGPS